MDLGTFVSLLGLGHSYVSGISSSKTIERITNRLNSIDIKLEKLSHNLLYAPSIEEITRLNNSSKAYLKQHEIVRLMEPITTSSQNPIIISSIYQSPNEVKQIFSDDYRNMFFGIQRLNELKMYNEPGTIPILFRDKGALYIGWQKKDILPLMFGFDYQPYSYAPAIGTFSSSINLEGEEQFIVKNVFPWVEIFGSTSREFLGIEIEFAKPIDSYKYFHVKMRSLDNRVYSLPPKLSYLQGNYLAYVLLIPCQFYRFKTKKEEKKKSIFTSKIIIQKCEGFFDVSISNTGRNDDIEFGLKRQKFNFSIEMISNSSTPNREIRNKYISAKKIHF